MSAGGITASVFFFLSLNRRLISRLINRYKCITQEKTSARAGVVDIFTIFPRNLGKARPAAKQQELFLGLS